MKSFMLVAPIPLCKYKGDAITKTTRKHPTGFKIQDTRYKIQFNNIYDYTLILITAIMCSVGAFTNNETGFNVNGCKWICSSFYKTKMALG